MPVVRDDPRQDRLGGVTLGEDRGTLDHRPTAPVLTRQSRDHVSNPLVVNHPTSPGARRHPAAGAPRWPIALAGHHLHAPPFLGVASCRRLGFSSSSVPLRPSIEIRSREEGSPRPSDTASQAAPATSDAESVPPPQLHRNPGSPPRGATAPSVALGLEPNVLAAGPAPKARYSLSEARSISSPMSCQAGQTSGGHDGPSHADTANAMGPGGWAQKTVDRQARSRRTPAPVRPSGTSRS